MTQKRQQPMGAKAVRGSEAARRLAALLLEAWSGVRSTQDASAAMGVQLTRFYQLEARALQCILEAMEPRPRGRRVTAEGELARLRLENQKLKRDAERFQALYRTTQRALGVTVAKAQVAAKNAAPGGKRRRGPRQRARGQAVAAVLLGGAPADGAKGADDGATEQGRGSHRRSAGRRAEQAAAAGDPEHGVGAAVGERGV